MRERIARTMFDCCAFRPNIEGLIGTRLEGLQKPWEEISGDAKLLWLRRADAVLDAMREPTEGMLECGRVHSLDPNKNRLGPAWRAMIDEAKK